MYYMYYLQLCITSSSWRPSSPHSSRSFLMREFWELSSTSNSETAEIRLSLPRLTDISRKQNRKKR